MAEQPRREILVIEDEEKIASLVKLELESIGYSVRTEGSGRAALTSAAEHQPDLVILDLKLPDMDGYEVCRELRNLSRAWVTPVLILTAMSQPIDQLRGFAHGADAYLIKPFELDTLVQTVAQLLGETTIA